MISEETSKKLLLFLLNTAGLRIIDAKKEIQPTANELDFGK